MNKYLNMFLIISLVFNEYIWSVVVYYILDYQSIPSQNGRYLRVKPGKGIS